MFYQIFLTPQVKRIAIISNKHGIYYFPHELPNDLRGNISRDSINELLNKIINSKKISMDHFKLCKAEISLDETINAINSQRKNKPPGSDGLTAEFHKHFSNDISPILLDLYNSWNELAIMGTTSTTGIISIIYKNGDKKILQSTDQSHS